MKYLASRNTFSLNTYNFQLEDSTTHSYVSRSQRANGFASVALWAYGVTVRASRRQEMFAEGFGNSIPLNGGPSSRVPKQY